jgi:HEAT repeat protein
MHRSRYKSLALLLLVLLSPGGVNGPTAKEKPSFSVEITTEDGAMLPTAGSYIFAGIEQTLVARVMPPAEDVQLEWAISPQAIRTYEHDVQDAGKHKTIPLSAEDLKGPKLKFFFTRPEDGVEVRVTARKGNQSVSAAVKFDVRLPKDANRLIYSFNDNDPRRNPNGLSATYAITRDHRRWHLGLRMSTGELPVNAALEDAGGKLVWGDLGYRDDPARLFDLDYNGAALLGWHGAALDAHRAWRRTFHIPCLDAATPPGSLPVPGYLKRVPDEKSEDQSRLYGYVRIGEFQNLDQLGRDLVHPWHNRSHTGIAEVNQETLMDNHGKSPPAKDDLFWRWHSVVEEVRRALGPDRATVAEVYPGNEATVGGLSSIYLAFDRKVSFNAPPANKVQLLPSLITVNGKPATTLEDVGGESARFIVFRVSGFPAPAEGPVRVELAETPGIERKEWAFTLRKSSETNHGLQAFRERAQQAYEQAQAQQREEDIERLLAKLKPAKADDLWLGALFRAHPLPASRGVPLLIELLDHPSDQVKGRAVQMLHYLYASEAASAVPSLSKLLFDSDREWWVRERAALALGKVSAQPDEAVSLLLASLENKKADEPVNVGSLEALGGLGPKAAAALPTVRKFLASNHPAVQRVAYQAVGQIVRAEAPSKAELRQLKVIDWESGDCGYAVHRALQQMAEEGAFAVPALVETFLRKPPVYAQAAVIETLGKVGGGPASARILLSVLPARFGGPGDPLEEKFLSDRAAESLARMPVSDPEVVPHFAEALSHDDPVVRFQAAKMLRRLGPLAEPAVDGLVRALLATDGTTDPYEIGAYLSALRAIGPGASRASALLVGLLSERSRLYQGQDPFWAHYLRAYILVTLADIGVPNEARPYILDLLSNSDKTTAHGYAAAARALRPDMTECLSSLQRALKSDFPDFPMSFDDFGRALGHEDSSCRLEALRALARMGPRAKEALPLVTRMASEKPDRGSPVPPWEEEARKAMQSIQGKE